MADEFVVKKSMAIFGCAEEVKALRKEAHAVNNKIVAIFIALNAEDTTKDSKKSLKEQRTNLVQRENEIREQLAQITYVK